MVLKVPISAKSQARLKAKANEVGLTPERYVKQLVDKELALDHLARTTSFEELLAPVREQFRQSGMTGDELDALIDRAKSRYRERVRRSRATGRRLGTQNRS